MANNSRIVPVPQRCQSVHAVFCPSPSSSDVDIEVPPAVLLRHFGATDDAVERLAGRIHCRLVSAEYTPESAAAAMAEVRRDALQLAAAHDGVVVDLLIPRIVTDGPDQAAATVAAQWVAMDLEDNVLHSRGLDAFGLPELSIAVASPEQTSMLLAIAMGLAQRLITEWPEQDPVGPAGVTLRDIALAYGDSDAASAPTSTAVDLLIDYLPHAETLRATLESDPAALFA